MVTLREAMERGISRVRDPQWSHPNDYLQITLIEKEDGTYGHGPWMNLFSPLQSVMGIPTPQTLLFTSVDWDEDGWEEYTGDLDGEDSQNKVL